MCNEDMRCMATILDIERLRGWGEVDLILVLILGCLADRKYH